MVALREMEVSQEKSLGYLAAFLVVFDSKREKVLLVRHSAQRKGGMVGFPGGSPLRGSSESLKETAIRELQEETGLRASTNNLLNYPGNDYYGILKREGEDKSFAFRAFICTNYQGEQKKASKEGKVFWATISKLDRYGSKLSPAVKTVVADSLRFLNNQHNG